MYISHISKETINGLKVVKVALNERRVSSTETESLNLLGFYLSLNISSDLLFFICIFFLIKQICKDLKIFLS